MSKIDYVDLELETGLDRMELEIYLISTCFNCPSTGKCLGNDCSLYNRRTKSCMRDIAAEFGAKAILYHKGVQNSLNKNW